MKTGRSVILVATSASMLAAGWAAGGGLLNSTGATTSAAAVSAGGSTQDTSSTSSTSSTAATAGAGTYDGAAVSTRYGNYQAEIIVTAGKITDISMLQSGNSDGTSQQISGYAVPQLISAVLQTQTAKVGYVSGASYTSQGFEASVQSAMQAAGLA